MDRIGLINLETGEVFKEIHPIHKRPVKQQSLEYLANTTEISKDKSFVKIFDNSISYLCDIGLTANDFSLIFHIMRYIRYTTGLIAYDNGVPLHINNISDIVGIPRVSISRSLNKLVNLGIIAKNTTEYRAKFYANPFIFLKGRRVNNTLISMFSNTKWASL